MKNFISKALLTTFCYFSLISMAYGQECKYSNSNICEVLKQSQMKLKQANLEKIENMQKQNQKAVQNLHYSPQVKEVKQEVKEDLQVSQDESEEIPKKFFKMIPADAVEPEPISGSAFIVRPERTTIVRLSATDINRFVCTEDLSREIRVVYPQRKGVKVKTAGNNIFVEFEIIKRGDEYVYQETPVELYIMCDDTVYAVIGIPQRIPAVTVYLENKAKDVQERLEAVKEIPFEERIVKIVKALYSGKPPIEAEYVKVSKEYNIYPALRIKETANYVFSAEGLVARVFMVSLKEEAKAEQVDLKEKDFLKKEITISPVGVAIDRLRLYKGEKAVVLIIEKKNVVTDRLFSF